MALKLSMHQWILKCSKIEMINFVDRYQSVLRQDYLLFCACILEKLDIRNYRKYRQILVFHYVCNKLENMKIF